MSCPNAQSVGVQTIASLQILMELCGWFGNLEPGTLLPTTPRNHQQKLPGTEVQSNLHAPFHYCTGRAIMFSRIYYNVSYPAVTDTARRRRFFWCITTRCLNVYLLISLQITLEIGRMYVWSTLYLAYVERRGVEISHRVQATYTYLIQTGMFYCNVVYCRNNCLACHTRSHSRKAKGNLSRRCPFRPLAPSMFTPTWYALPVGYFKILWAHI